MFGLIVQTIRFLSPTFVFAIMRDAAPESIDAYIAMKNLQFCSFRMIS